MGEGAIIATGGQNVYPARTLQSGFVYEFKDCKEALIDLLSH
jgi:NAD dependent epimerase/dehydratase family enzyme